MKEMKPLDYTIIVSSVIILGIVLVSVDLRGSKARESEEVLEIVKKELPKVVNKPAPGSSNPRLRQANPASRKKTKDPGAPYGDYNFRLGVNDHLKSQSDMLKEELFAEKEGGEKRSLALSEEEISALEDSGALIH